MARLVKSRPRHEKTKILVMDIMGCCTHQKRFARCSTCMGEKFKSSCPSKMYKSGSNGMPSKNMKRTPPFFNHSDTMFLKRMICI